MMMMVMVMVMMMVMVMVVVLLVMVMMDSCLPRTTSTRVAGTTMVLAVAK